MVGVVMKLEEGKRYVQRNGHVTGPLKYRGFCYLYAWEDSDNPHYAWTSTGDFLVGQMSVCDLMNEYVGSTPKQGLDRRLSTAETVLCIIVGVLCAMLLAGCNTPPVDTRHGYSLEVTAEAELELEGVYDAAEHAAAYWRALGHRIVAGPPPGPNYRSVQVRMSDADDGNIAWGNRHVWVRRTSDGRPLVQSSELCGCYPDVCYYDLSDLLVHEVGHILGFQHSESPLDVMYPGLCRDGL